MATWMAWLARPRPCLMTQSCRTTLPLPSTRVRHLPLPIFLAPSISPAPILDIASADTVRNTHTHTHTGTPSSAWGFKSVFGLSKNVTSSIKKVASASSSPSQQESRRCVLCTSRHIPTCKHIDTQHLWACCCSATCCICILERRKCASVS
jgi:hypothetical protein